MKEKMGDMANNTTNSSHRLIEGEVRGEG